MELGIALYCGEECMENLVCFRIVIVGFRGRGAKGDDDLFAGNPKFFKCHPSWIESGRVHIFLDTGILLKSVGRDAAYGFWIAAWSDLPLGFTERRRGHVFIVDELYGGNAKKVGCEYLRASPVREGKVGQGFAEKTITVERPGEE